MSSSSSKTRSGGKFKSSLSPRSTSGGRKKNVLAKREEGQVTLCSSSIANLGDDPHVAGWLAGWLAKAPALLV